MINDIKPGDIVRITDKAIRQCRRYFGRHAKWQAKDQFQYYDVVNVIEDVAIIEVRKRDKANAKIEQIAACHLELTT